MVDEFSRSSFYRHICNQVIRVLSKRKLLIKLRYSGGKKGSLGQEDPSEKEMANHSIVLAWKIPWTEEPGKLQSMGVAKSWI